MALRSYRAGPALGPLVLPRASLLLHPALPGRGRALSLTPAEEPDSGFWRSHPEALAPSSSPAPPPAAACSPAPFFPPFLSLPILLSPLLSPTCTRPGPCPQSFRLPLCLADALSRASSPPPCAALTFCALHGVPPATRRAQGADALWAARGPAEPGPHRPLGSPLAPRSSLRPGGRLRPALASAVADSSHLARA